MTSSARTDGTSTRTCSTWTPEWSTRRRHMPPLSSRHDPLLLRRRRRLLLPRRGNRLSGRATASACTRGTAASSRSTAGWGPPRRPTTLCTRFPREHCCYVRPRVRCSDTIDGRLTGARLFHPGGGNGKKVGIGGSVGNGGNQGRPFGGGGSGAGAGAPAGGALRSVSKYGSSSVSPGVSVTDSIVAGNGAGRATASGTVAESSTVTLAAAPQEWLRLWLRTIACHDASRIADLVVEQEVRGRSRVPHL